MTIALYFLGGVRLPETVYPSCAIGRTTDAGPPCDQGGGNHG
jgi:hypothetical protein